MAAKGRYVDDVQTTNTDFTSASKGQISDKSLGSLFETAGEAVGSAIKIADRQFIQSIENKVQDWSQGLTSDQDPALMEFASEGVPSEITQGTDNIIKLSKAYGNGLISDSQYYMRAAALAKRLKEQYPGHREYVDAAISKARGSSANIARSQLLSELDKLASARSASDKKTDDTLRDGIKNGWITQKDIEKYGREGAASLALHNQGARARWDRANEEIKTRHEIGNLNQENDVEVFNAGVDNLINTTVSMALKNALGTPGAVGNISDLSRHLANVDISKMDPQQMSQIWEAGNQLVLKIKDNVKSSEGYQLLTPEGQRKVDATLDSKLEHLENALQSKDWNMFTDATKSLDIVTNQSAAQLSRYYNLPEAKAVYKTFVEAFPENSPQRLELENIYQKRFLGDIPTEGLAKGLSVRIMEGEATVGESFRILARDKNLSGDQQVKVMATIMDTANQVFLKEDPSSSRFQETAKALFVENPGRILDIWGTQTEKLKVWDRLVDPRVSQKLLANPQIANAYQAWVAKSFAAITTSEVGDLNDAADAYLSNKYWNPGTENNNFQIVMDPENGQFTALMPKTGRPLSSTETRAYNSMKVINGLLARMTPILTHGNRTKPQMLEDIIMNGGTGYREGKDPFTKTIFESLSHWYISARNKILPNTEAVDAFGQGDGVKAE